MTNPSIPIHHRWVSHSPLAFSQRDSFVPDPLTVDKQEAPRPAVDVGSATSVPCPEIVLRREVHAIAAEDAIFLDRHSANAAGKSFNERPGFLDCLSPNFGRIKRWPPNRLGIRLPWRFRTQLISCIWRVSWAVSWAKGRPE